MNDSINLRCFFHILSCKIRPRKFIDRNIFYTGYEKKNDKFLIIQTPSFDTSKDYGFLLLSKFPLPKTSIEKKVTR